MFLIAAFYKHMKLRTKWEVERPRSGMLLYRENGVAYCFPVYKKMTRPFLKHG